MSRHHGHSHDHGGNEPPWLNRLQLLLVIGLIIVIVVLLILDKMNRLPSQPAL